MSEQWEYLTKILTAEATRKEIKDYLRERFNVTRPPRFTPESLIPELNELGSQGWELVQMQPVAKVGKKGNILFSGEIPKWSNVYFCVFKRRKPGSSLPVNIASSAQQGYTTPVPAQYQAQQQAQQRQAAEQQAAQQAATPAERLGSMIEQDRTPKT